MIEIIVMMQSAGLIIIWPVSLILLLLILLQGGAGDISSSFGGGGQLDSSLGVGAASKISKVTGWLVAVFLFLIVVLSINPDGALTGSDMIEGAADAQNADTSAVIDAESSAVPADSEATQTVETANAAETTDTEKVEKTEAEVTDKQNVDAEAAVNPEAKPEVAPTVPAAPDIEVVE